MKRTVVITRPDQQAQEWVDAFRAHSFHVRHIPLLQITSAPNSALITKAWQNIEQWNWIMFVSKNAVNYFFEHPARKNWPNNLKVGSPGTGTTSALIKHGIPPELIDQPQSHQTKDTENLWHNIKNRIWQSACVLLVRGSSRDHVAPRDWLMNQLENAGAFVQPLVVYQRESGIFSNEAKKWISSEQAKQACWIISSKESLEALKGKADWSQATAIVIHPRIAQAAQDTGFKQIVCIQPDLNALINSVESVV